MTSEAARLARRQHVGALYLRGESSGRIATQLEMSSRTVERDVAQVRKDLEAASLASLDAKRARSVAALRLAQSEAWRLYHRLPDEQANAKMGAINAVINAEASIARLEGTLNSDLIQQTTVNILASEDWLRTRGVLLATLARFPEARGAVVEALRALEPAQMQEGARDGAVGTDGHDDDQ